MNIEERQGAMAEFLSSLQREMAIASAELDEVYGIIGVDRAHHRDARQRLLGVRARLERTAEVAKMLDPRPQPPVDNRVIYEDAQGGAAGGGDTPPVEIVDQPAPTDEGSNAPPADHEEPKPRKKKGW